MSRSPVRLTVLIAALALAAPLVVFHATASEPDAPQQRGRGGAGIARGVGAPRGGTSQRGSGPGRSGSSSRIQQRSYVFQETGETIAYSVFVSSKVDPEKKSPLVIGLHGLGVEPAMWLSRLRDAVENAGYIIAAPTGYTLLGWYGANGPSSGRGVANLGVKSEQDVLNVLALMREEFNIDERRIYLAGHSMGGAGALYLGPKHKNIWAAVAVSAPAIRTAFQKPSDLEAGRELPFILIHGDADTAVPIEQTRVWAAKMKEIGMTYEYREVRGGTHASTFNSMAPEVFKFFDKHVKPEGK